jgi:hypothetical protein
MPAVYKPGGRAIWKNSPQTYHAAVEGQQSAIGIVTRPELANLSAGASPNCLQISKKSIRVPKGILKSVTNLLDFHNYYLLPNYYYYYY